MAFCPYCGTGDLVKAGFDRYRGQSRQRYRCRRCQAVTIHPLKTKPKRRRKYGSAR